MPDVENHRPDPLLIGGHLAMDLLNSIATPVDTPVEWLASGVDLLDWLQRSGTLTSQDVERARVQISERDFNETARKAREFREWLRPLVRKRAGQPSIRLTRHEVAPLNALLAASTSHEQIEPGAPPKLIRHRPMNDPRQLLEPLAQAAADLFCNADFTLVRACEGHGCTLMFLDTTKSHRRRWCSMGLCGNRSKVASFREREKG